MNPNVILPWEFVIRCINDVWHDDLTIDDRITFMTSSLLVSKRWKSHFADVSFTHVHIPCASYVEPYIRFLRQQSGIHPYYHLHYKQDPKLSTQDNAKKEEVFRWHNRKHPERLCRSITFHVRPTLNRSFVGPQNVPGAFVDGLLYIIDTGNYLSYNNYAVRIEYTNVAPEDSFTYHAPTSFPKNITCLELAPGPYSSRPRPAPVVLRAGQIAPQSELDLQCTLRGVSTLVVYGATPAFVNGLISVCPKLCEVTTDCVRAVNARKPELLIPGHLGYINVLCGRGKGGVRPRTLEGLPPRRKTTLLRFPPHQSLRISEYSG